MASFLSALNPVPSFPDYTGPYKVGTVDVEIPVSELVPPSPTPDGAEDLHTVQFRVFFPGVPEPRGKRVTWVPAPQRLHVAAYAQFLGIGSTLASILSFLPRHLHWTTIPAIKNAALLPPPSDSPRSRWPTMIFSHGLGGHRNAYSHLAGSLASYGVVVVCPEHRDSSAPLSLVRDPQNQDSFSVKNTRRVVPYSRIPHAQTHEIWEARNKQLRIRLWELGIIFEAITAIDRGDGSLIKSNLNGNTPERALSQFAGKLDVLDPGRVIFAGHSFGAVTMVQLLKSTYYRGHPSVKAMPSPLLTPTDTSAIAKQITPDNPTILLDMWCFPLLSASTAPLYNLPLPCYTPSPSPSPISRLLAIESAAFFKWSEHLHAKARILSPSPSAVTRRVSQDEFDRRRLSKPHFFYVDGSAHLSQGDFGVLFPSLTTGRLLGADRRALSERVLRLNVRAQLQFLRENGVVVAGTAKADVMADGLGVSGRGEGEAGEWVERDEGILHGGGGEGECVEGDRCSGLGGWGVSF
ncbi:putative phospholipase A2 [Madurella mycetomatis]|uniref:Putative phospholipase n=1 Tax=Madurella mycetomatis TaxID=100816 RepID=A0A175VZ34_9PEZI|nr:putative phospholipase A2 [Madurella mycetomatis]